MLDGIERLLWQTSEPNQTGHSLMVRIGSGRATYHRYQPEERTHTINLGIKMIAAKQQPADCGAWLSTREILARRYFGGEISEANLLAHTCCHEFAHLLQAARGERRYGSVHNRAFYDQLDQLYHRGHANKLRLWLIQEGQRHGWAVATHPVDLDTTPGPVASHHFSKGERVYFWYRDTRHTGRITRINRQTCSVIGIGVSQGLRFRVPPRLLHSFDRG